MNSFAWESIINADKSVRERIIESIISRISYAQHEKNSTDYSEIIKFMLNIKELRTDLRDKLIMLSLRYNWTLVAKTFLASTIEFKGEKNGFEISQRKNQKLSSN